VLAVPDKLHEAAGVNVPVLLLERLTDPVGVRFPIASDTVTVHEVATPTVTDEPHTILVVVGIGLTVNNSQLLETALLFLSPLYVALKPYCPTELGVWEPEAGTAPPLPIFTA